MTGLVLDNVSRHFGGLRAVDGISLTVPPGQITSLIGPNGAGKSTVVNLVCGLLRLTSGRIVLDGRDVSAAEAPEIARAGVARTFQTVRLIKDASVLDNVAAGFLSRDNGSLIGQLLALPSARARLRDNRDRAGEILARFGMSDVASIPAGMLAYGHQRRVEMMRALALIPRVLLLDEPVAGMNDGEIRDLGRIFRELADEGIALLLIEHNMRFVLSVSDEVHVLDSGRLIASGAPEAVRTNPAVIQAYLGDNYA